MGALLAWIARTGRLWLIAGIVAGLLLPGAAQLLQPWIGEMVALLLLRRGCMLTGGCTGMANMRCASFHRRQM